jgi:hypothetical protein
MRAKAEVERHLNLDRAGDLLPCADRRCGVLGLTMTMCSPNVGLNGVALMSKPDETPPVKPDTPKLFKGMVLPDNCRDVTAERTGERFALVGPPMRRIEPTKD